MKGIRSDRVPDELWTEVHDIVRMQESRPSPIKRNAKKARWLSEKALQIAVKRREVKGKGEKERYTLLNAVPKESKERQESFLQRSMQGNRGKQ